MEVGFKVYQGWFNYNFCTGIWGHLGCVLFSAIISATSKSLYSNILILYQVWEFVEGQLALLLIFILPQHMLH